MGKMARFDTLSWLSSRSMTDSHDSQRESAQAKAEEYVRIRSRVQVASSAAWTVFLVPVLFFIISLLLASLVESQQIDPTVQWIVLGTVAVIALAVTLNVLRRQPLIRRGYRLTACSLVVYLVAVRAAISAQREYDAPGFWTVFFIALFLIVLFGQVARRRELPSKAEPYLDLSTDERCWPIITALSMADRAKRSALRDVCGLSDSSLDDGIRKLEQHGYVRVKGAQDTDQAVSPTRFLRVTARISQKGWEQKARQGLPSWLDDRS